MKKIKLIFSLLLIVTLLISPMNVLAVTTGEGTVSTTDNLTIQNARLSEMFCFQLIEDEYADLRSQIATSNTENAYSK